MMVRVRHALRAALIMMAVMIAGAAVVMLSAAWRRMIRAGRRMQQAVSSEAVAVSEALDTSMKTLHGDVADLRPPDFTQRWAERCERLVTRLR